MPELPRVSVQNFSLTFIRQLSLVVLASVTAPLSPCLLSFLFSSADSLARNSRATMLSPIAKAQVLDGYAMNEHEYAIDHVGMGDMRIGAACSYDSCARKRGATHSCFSRTGSQYLAQSQVSSVPCDFFFVCVRRMDTDAMNEVWASAFGVSAFRAASR